MITEDRKTKNERKYYNKCLRLRQLHELNKTIKAIRSENDIIYIIDESFNTKELKKTKKIYFYRGTCFEILFIKDTDEPFLIFFSRGFDDLKHDPRITKCWIYRLLYKTYVNLNNLKMKTFKIDDCNVELYEADLPPRLNNFIKNWVKKYQTILINKIRG